MGFFSSITKPFKKAVKSVTKVVKKVAKAVVKVGKKVVSGVKKAVKTVGKSLSKLGPLASIALMAIPGFQAFAAGLAGGLGFTSTLAANVASGALTGFITSGGNLKSAVVGGVMGGAGSYLGDAAKGAWKSGSLSTGFAQANAAAMAPSAFTGGLTGAAGFQAGLDSAAQSWGNFTDSVGKFFSSNSPTGDIANGASNYTNTFDKYGMSPNEYMEVYGKAPDTVVSATQATLDMDPATAMQKAQAGQITEQAKMLAEQNAAFGVEGVDNLRDAFTQTTPTELAASPTFGAPQIVQEQWDATLKSMGITPGSEQAKMLAEQQFGESMPVMTKDASGQWNYAKYDTTGDLAFTGWDDFQSLAQAGAYQMTPTPTPSTGMPKGLLSPDATSFSQVPFVMTDPGKGIGAIKATGAVGGAGGMLGFTDVQRQTQAQLIAQAEQQAELARKRAASGWGVA